MYQQDTLELPVSSDEDDQFEHTDDLEDEDLQSSYTKRAMLLNDGVANLYKERAETVKKQKAREEDSLSVLQHEKLFLKELSNRFRASSE